MLNERNQIDNFLLCLWELLWFHYITVQVPLSSVVKVQFRFRYGKKLRFLHLQFRFRNTGYKTTKIESKIGEWETQLQETDLARLYDDIFWLRWWWYH